MSRIQDTKTQEIQDALADWYVRLESPDASESDVSKFETWLSEDDERKAAHHKLRSALAALDLAAVDETLFDAHFTPKLAGTADNVVTLSSGKTSTSSRRWWGTAIAASIAGLLVVSGIWTQLSTPEMTTVATTIGEQMEISLGDGSTVHANTDTELNYRIHDERREVMLHEGEAFFEVAKDSDRPFVVTVGEHTVTVTGTAFNIKYLSGDAELTVTEGSTILSDNALFGKRSEPVLAGQVAAFSSTRPSKVLAANTLDLAGSWRTGQLIYRDQSLSEIVSDLDRYLPSEFGLSANSSRPENASTRYSLVLQVDEEDAMLNRLELLLPIDVRSAGRDRYEAVVLK